MLLTEEQWYNLQPSPLRNRIRQWTKQGDEMLAGEKTYYYCGPANKYRNVFSCILFCSLDQESINCSEIPYDLRDCIPELTELWYATERESTMKKLIKKSVPTAKQVTPIVTKTVKAVAPVTNGNFQDMVKAMIDGLDNRLNPIKETIQGNSVAIAKILNNTSELNKAVALLFKGLDEIRSTVVTLKKAIDNLPDSNEETVTEETVTDKKTGRPPVGKMTVKSALSQIAEENDVDVSKGEKFDESAFDEIFKLVCDLTGHIQQKAFVKATAQGMDLLD